MRNHMAGRRWGEKAIIGEWSEGEVAELGLAVSLTDWCHFHVAFLCNQIPDFFSPLTIPTVAKWHRGTRRFSWPRGSMVSLEAANLTPKKQGSVGAGWKGVR